MITAFSKTNNVVAIAAVPDAVTTAAPLQVLPNVVLSLVGLFKRV
jgi:hypothetical protein